MMRILQTLQVRMRLDLHPLMLYTQMADYARVGSSKVADGAGKDQLFNWPGTAKSVLVRCKFLEAQEYSIP